MNVRFGSKADARHHPKGVFFSSLRESDNGQKRTFGMNQFTEPLLLLFGTVRSWVDRSRLDYFQIIKDDDGK